MSSRLSLLLTAVLTSLPACGDAGVGALPSLQINGELLGTAGDLTLPSVKVGDVASVSLELANLGDAPLRLTGDPPVRVVDDSALAFATTQPSLRELPPDAATSFVVTFTPRMTGAAAALLVVPSDAADAPEITLTLTGEGLPGGVPSLALSVDGIASPDAWDFGRLEVDAQADVTVRLTNDGAGTLTFGPASVAVLGDDADQFSVVGPDQLALGAEETATATLTFAPTRCGAFTARLSVATNAAGDPLSLPLGGSAIVSPLALSNVTDTSLIQVPDLTTVASADGAHIAVANPAADGFDGLLTLATFAGCGLSASGRISAGDVGYGGSLFAAAADLTDDGGTLLVTARDYATAWLFDLSREDDAAPLTLATADAGAGHGRAAALAADGSAAVIGQPLAVVGGAARGAAFVWARPGGGWASASDATVKLLPSDVAEVVRLGQSVDASANGAVIVVGALVRRPDQALAPGACVYLAHDDTWGEERLPTNAYVRDPTLTLVGRATASDNATVRAAVSKDGETVAVAVSQPGGSVDLLLFEATDLGWGVPTEAAGTANETAHLRLAGASGWRFALAPDARYIIAGDTSGLVELDRPEAGWSDAVAPSQRWEVHAFGDILLLDDGAILGVLTPDGSLEILWR